MDSKYLNYMLGQGDQVFKSLQNHFLTSEEILMRVYATVINIDIAFTRNIYGCFSATNTISPTWYIALVQGVVLIIMREPYSVGIWRTGSQFLKGKKGLLKEHFLKTCW